MYKDLSHDVASGSDVTLCNKSENRFWAIAESDDILIEISF